MAKGKKPAGPAQARAHTVHDTYFGVQVPDSYRWMEQSESVEFRRWTELQDQYTRATLANVPARSEMQKRMAELSGAAPQVKDVQRKQGAVFYLKRPADADDFRLYMRDGFYGKERLLVEPGRLKSGEISSIDYYEPSPDAKYVAFGISSGGSEDSVIRIMEVSSRAVLPEQIDRAMFGQPHWRADSKSFFYKRMPKAELGATVNHYQRMRDYLHFIGQQPDMDQAVFGYGVSPHVPIAADDFPYVHVWPGSHYAVAVVVHGVLSELSIYAAPLDAAIDAKTPWRKIADIQDGVLGYDVHGDDLFLITHRDAPRGRVIRTSLSHPDVAKAETIIPAGSRVVAEIATAQDALYVRLLGSGIGRLLRVPYGAGKSEEVRLPIDGSIRGMSSQADLPGVVFRLQSWVRSPRFYYFDPIERRVVNTSLLEESPVESNEYESREVMVTSTDGTAVPLSIIYRHGLNLDGKAPALLSVYGSYGESYDASFWPRRLAWLERGGVYAVAHVRGGGEQGEEWHVAGMKTHKQKSVDDFVACAQYLIANGYTSSPRLAAEGSSAGGIVVGAVIVQRPVLFRAAVIYVGLLDLLRAERSASGPANTAEFGSTTIEEEFVGLAAISPYHHVRDGVEYPAVLLTGASNDARVPAWQPAKMAARLQAAGHRRPVLLRVERGGGHGMDTSRAQIDEETTDAYSFLLWQLGEPAFRISTERQ